MNFDEVLSQIGSYGTFQKKLVAFSFFVGIICGFNVVNTVFTQYTPEHHCNVAPLNETSVYLIPNETDSWGDTKQSSCTHYNMTSINQTEIIHCQNGWTYTGPFVSIINEFNIVCARKWIKAAIWSAFFGCRIIGFTLDGVLSDKIGRKNVLMVLLFLQSAVPLAMSLSPNIWTYAVFLSLYGAIASTTYSSMYILSSEVTGPKWRNLLNLSINAGYIFGYFSLPLIAYLTRHWRTFLRVISVAGLVVFGPSFRILPESSRWLMSKRDDEGVLKCLKTVAKENKYNGNIDDLIMKQNYKLVNKEKEPDLVLEFTDALRNGKFMRKFLVLIFTWFFTNITYYGLMASSDSFGGDIFMSCFYAGIIELPCILIAYKIMAKIGRPVSLSGWLVLSGVACIASPLIKTWSIPLSAALAIIGKGGITAVYYVLVMYTCEVLPTILRTRLCNICGASGKVGAVISPYILLLGEVASPLVPFFTMGVGAVVMGALTLVLMPETANVSLPETLEDVINMQTIRKKMRAKRSKPEREDCCDNGQGEVLL